MKGLINIKNNDNKCFLCYHIRHLSLVKTHPERITKEDRNMVDDLDYEGMRFPVSKKDYCKIERQNNSCIICLIICISRILKNSCAIKQKIEKEYF